MSKIPMSDIDAALARVPGMDRMIAEKEEEAAKTLPAGPPDPEAIRAKVEREVRREVEKRLARETITLTVAQFIDLSERAKDGDRARERAAKMRAAWAAKGTKPGRKGGKP